LSGKWRTKWWKRGEIGDGPFGAMVCEDGDPVALGDPEAGEGGGESIDGIPQRAAADIPVRAILSLAPERRLMRMALRRGRTGSEG
jgi:hypothetical protein